MKKSFYSGKVSDIVPILHNGKNMGSTWNIKGIMYVDLYYSFVKSLIHSRHSLLKEDKPLFPCHNEWPDIKYINKIIGKIIKKCVVMSAASKEN